MRQGVSRKAEMREAEVPVGGMVLLVSSCWKGMLLTVC